MTAPKLARQGKGGRYYENRNYPDRRFISVTTVLKVLDKPALVGWAAKMVAEEFMAELPAAVKASRRKETRADFLRHIKGSPYAKRDAAANRGTEVHAAAEAHVLGKPHAVAEDIQPFVDQYLDAIDTLGLHFEASEATVAHPELGFAGTGDIWAKMAAADGLWNIDIKTGDASKAVDVVYDDHAFQLAALANCTELWLPDHTILDAPKVDRSAILNLRPNGWALVPLRESRLAQAWDVFQHCVHIAAVRRDADGDLFEGQFRPPSEADSPFVKEQPRRRSATREKASA